MVWPKLQMKNDTVVRTYDEMVSFTNSCIVQAAPSNATMNGLAIKFAFYSVLIRRTHLFFQAIAGLTNFDVFAVKEIISVDGRFDEHSFRTVFSYGLGNSDLYKAYGNILKQFCTRTRRCSHLSILRELTHVMLQIKFFQRCVRDSPQALINPLLSQIVDT